MRRRSVRWVGWLVALALCAPACGRHDKRAPEPSVEAKTHAPEPSKGPPPTPWHAEPPPAAEALAEPVPLWEHGKIVKQVDAQKASAQGYVVLDLGEAWVPYIFSDGTREDGTPLPNAYREIYLELARGEFPDNYHGERARADKYLELYGIMPTLSLLRDRFRHVAHLECAKNLDLQPLIDFQGLIVHESNQAAAKAVADYQYLRGQVDQLMKAQHVATPEALDQSLLTDRDKDRLKRYPKAAAEFHVIDAAQKRLVCEGFLTRANGRYTRGAMDWATRDALAEFERRHRVYSWGYLGKDTLEVMRMTPAESERQSVVRILGERAMHAAGVLEDGSTSTFSNGAPRTFQGIDGKDHPIPNLEAALEKDVIDAFGLETPESALAWLESLGPLPAGAHHFVALRGPELPEYYDGDMALTLDYDRGDVWYDFPFDAHGKEIAQPVSIRPTVTVFTRYLDQKIPLATYGTTIGGWRSEQIGETVMWKYKESPVGPRVWSQIVASPVWLPPDTTPAKELLKKRKKPEPGQQPYEINYYETGPSYASAYGLVAAYHNKYFENAKGAIAIGQDEGIRTHGSVDYMSIMRRHSHGCHRLHNHIAVRLMSFVLAHRPHRRVGQEALSFKKEITYEDQKYLMDIKQGGYIFQLDTPLKIEVLEGRIRGQVKQPIEFAIPKYDEARGAYVMPDGHAVEVHGDTLIDVPLPEQPDGGVLEAQVTLPTGIPSGIPSGPPRLQVRARVDGKAPADPKSPPPAFFAKP
jgi:hypothetical protein